MKTVVDPSFVLALRKRMEEICIRGNNAERRLTALMDAALCDHTVETEEIKTQGLYRAIVLGTESFGSLNSILGVNCTGILRTSFRSPIRIERTMARSDVLIEFIEDRSKLSDNNNTRIEKSFIRRGIHMDIERHPKTVPPLVIENAAKFLVTVDEDIRILDGRGIVKRIVIHLPLLSGHSVTSSVRSIDIVPENLLFSETGSEVKSHKLLSLLAMHGVDFYNANMVLLNSTDPSVIRSFAALLGTFMEYYDVERYGCYGLMPSIFYSASDSAAVMEKGVGKDETKIGALVSLFEKIEKRHRWEGIQETLGAILNIFITKQQFLPNLTAEIEKTLTQYGHILSLLPRDVVRDSEFIRRRLMEARHFCRENEGDRQDCIGRIDELFSYLINFSSEYNSRRTQLDIKSSQSLFRERSEFQLKRWRPFYLLWLSKRYRVGTKDFRSFLSNWFNDLEEMTMSMFEHLDFVELNDFMETLERYMPRLRDYNAKNNFYDEMISFLSRIMVTARLS